MAKFKTVGGGHVAIFVDWQPSPISVPGEYETDDKRELQALKDSSEVYEAKDLKASKDTKTK